jgi:hypothetical protein
MDTVVYTLVPPQGKASTALWFPPIILVVVLLVVGILVTKTIAGAKSSTFSLSSAGLMIRGDLWGRTVPAAHLRGSEARVVDLRNEPSLLPRRRTAGTAIPGYRSGWWRLASGERSLLYLTAPDRVAYVPTTEGFSLLLSVSDPERFVEHLRRVAPAG